MKLLNKFHSKTINNYKIRKVKKTDFESFIKVLEAGWLMAHINKDANIDKKDIKEKFANKKFHKTKFIEKSINSHLVMEHNNKLIGLIGIKEDSKYKYSGGIYLLPKYTGKGLGKLLINEIIQLLPPGAKYTVEIAEFNQISQKFFKKMGFHKISKQGFYSGFKDQSKGFKTIFYQKII